MKRRAAIVALALAAAAAVAPTALAAPSGTVLVPRGDTNGCIVIPALELAICIPRL